MPMFAVRLAVSSVLAFGITTALFFGMQYMIAMGDAAIEDKESIRVIDFVRIKHEAVVQEKERALPSKPKALDQPNAPQISPSTPSAAGGLDPGALAIKAPAADAPLKLKAMPKLGATAVSDRAETPLVRIKAQYPLRASQDGIEGHVVVRFDVNPQGQVENVVVVAAKPRGVFERATTKAVRRWRYRPKVDNGVAVWRRGVTVRMPFRLTN